MATLDEYYAQPGGFLDIRNMSKMYTDDATATTIKNLPAEQKNPLIPDSNVVGLDPQQLRLVSQWAQGNMNRGGAPFQAMPALGPTPEDTRNATAEADRQVRVAAAARTNPVHTSPQGDTSQPAYLGRPSLIGGYTQQLRTTLG